VTGKGQRELDEASHRLLELGFASGLDLAPDNDRQSGRDILLVADSCWGVILGVVHLNVLRLIFQRPLLLVDALHFAFA
jgi:hypothetical protein